MKKPLKIAVIILAVILFVIVAVSVLIKSFLTEERVRALVVETVEKSLHRRTAIGAVDVSLFRGIVVKDFEIRERDAESVFFRTKEFVLAYQFMPLLTRKLVIDQLSITDAEINVKVNPDGTYNFSDMARTDKPEEIKEEEKGASGLPVALNVKTIRIENAKLGYADPMGKLQKADVVLQAELILTGHSPTALSSSGSFEVTLAQAVVKDKKTTLKDLRTTARYSLDADMEAKRLTLHFVDLDIMKIPVNISGTVDYASPTAYALAVKVPDYNLSQIPPDLASAFLPGEMTFGGNISILLHLAKKAGAENSADIDGQIRMNRSSFANQSLNLVLDGIVKLTQDVIRLESVKLIAGRNAADISGAVKNYRETPDITVNVQSKFISLDDLLVPAPASAKSRETAGSGEDQKSAPAKKELEPMDLKLKINASLDIDKTSYKGISITGFSSRYELKNNIFTIPYLKGHTLDGAFALRGAVNLAQKGTRYNLHADLNGVRVEELVQIAAPKAKGVISGVLSGKAEFTGAGTLSENIKRNLKGNGKFVIQKGALKNAEIITGLLAILGLNQMKEIPIDKADSTFTIANGIVNLKTLIGSKDMMIDEKGTIGMDQKLDLGVLVKVSDRLAPGVVSQSSVAKFLSGEKGWTSVPLKVEGTLSKPSYGIDTKAVGKKVTEGLQQKAGEELRNILLKDRKPPAAGKEGKSSNGKSLIRDIFGR